jgi:hypothetical protein
MHAELVVPGLFGRDDDTRHPALELLLARGRRQNRIRALTPNSDLLEEWIGEAFELGDGLFPAGALTVLAGGGDPGSAHWTRADPVHMSVMRDHAVTVHEGFELPAEEAQALCDALTRHFTNQLEFHACEPRYWSARRISNVPLDDVLLNEAQMLLHAQPVNQAREARGELPINSLAFWGAGPAPRTAQSRWQSVAADDPAVRGAARRAGARHRTLPRSAQDWLDRLPEDGRHLALVDARRAPLADLERDWFAPLLAALRADRAGMVTVHVPDAAEQVSFETIRGDLRRFWRRPRALARFK